MPWIKMKADHNHATAPNQTVHYRKGGRYLVKEELAKQLIDAGQAEPTERPTGAPAQVSGPASSRPARERAARS